MMFTGNNRLGAVSFTNIVLSSTTIKTDQPRDHMIRMERNRSPGFALMLSCLR